MTEESDEASESSEEVEGAKGAKGFELEATDSKAAEGFERVAGLGMIINNMKWTVEIGLARLVPQH